MKRLVLAAAFAAALSGGQASAQSTGAYLGEIIIMTGNFCPVGWAQANGQLLQISQNTALFGLIGTKYGGDGRTTFALPDLTGGTIGPKAQPLTWCIKLTAGAAMKK